MARLGIFALVGAAILGFLTYTEGTLAFQASAQPEKVTLKDLIARGPEGNTYLEVTDFALCDNLVHQFKDNNKSAWTHVWIPAIPRDEVNPLHVGPLQPADVKVLFFSVNIRNERELESKLNRPSVNVLVTNRIASLDSKVKDMLKQSYPGIDFQTCLILQEGRTPWSRGNIYLIGAGAVLSVFIGITLLLVSRQRSRGDASA